MPLLSIKNLTVRMGDRTILSDVSFDLHQGEILGLFGDSGSGKSTILHTIFGLHPRNVEVEGDIVMDGRSLMHDPPEVRSHRGMGIVLQDLGLFDDRNVYDNVAYPLRRRKWNEEKISVAVKDVLSFLHIQDLAQRHLHRISGGQRQRVALARSLVYQPRVLLLDEPLRGLQEELKLQFLAYIRTIGRYRETSIVFVTHERHELELVAHSIIKIDHGRLLSQERSVDGERFSTLAPVVRIPDPGNPGHHYRVMGLRLFLSGTLAVDETETFIDIQEWRLLSDGRYGALVQFGSGEPGWFLFDPLNAKTRDLPLSKVRVAFKKINVEGETWR